MKNRLVNISLLIGVLGFIIILIPLLSTLSHESIIRIAFIIGIITIVLSILSIIFNKNKQRSILVLIIGVSTVLLSLFYDYYISSDSKILNKIDQFISGNKIETDWDEEIINEEDNNSSTSKTYNSLEELKQDYNIDIILSNYLINNTENEYSAYLPVTITNNDKKRVSMEISVSATNKKTNSTLERYTIYVDSLPQSKSQKYKSFITYDANETQKVFGPNIKDITFSISSIKIYLD